MKKTLLTAAFAALAMGSAYAQIYDNYHDILFDTMSDNGQFVSGTNTHSGISLLNRYTGEQFDYYDPDGIITYGINFITNTGLAVGNNSADGCYWKDGKYYVLPKPEWAGSGQGNGIYATNNDKYIAGSASTDVNFGADGIMSLPVIWTLQDDGTYKPETLPYDKLDFSGRPPQYVTANCITEDGKTVIVQVRDYSGSVVYPAIYKKGDDGKWTYKTYGEGVFWDKEKMAALPEMPVDPSDEIPDPVSYFTKEDTIAYNKAVEEYSDILDQLNQGIITDWGKLPTYPEYWMFITTNHDQWAADSTVYTDKCNKYVADMNAYTQQFYKALYQKGLVFNQLKLSGNGRYVATAIADNKANIKYPAYIDLAQDEISVKEIDAYPDALCSGITNDGLMTMVSPAMEYTRNTKVCKIGENEDAPVDFIDYITTRDEKAAAFMKENYTYNVLVSDGSDEPGWGGDEGDGGGVLLSNGKARPMDYITVPDSTLCGTITVNSDGTIFSGFLRECFSNEYFTDVDHSFVLDLNKGAISGINAVKAADETDAPVIGCEYYSINGQRLGRLPLKGVYLEKVITAKGAKTFKRVK